MVDRRLRRALTPDWIELDLKTAHAAIASTLWDIRALWQALSSGLSLWTHLLDYLGVKSELWPRVKPCIKTAFYATLYGMGENAIDRTFWKNLDKEFRQDGGLPYFPKRLIDNELIQEVIQARDAEMERVINEDGSLTPFGWLPLEIDWHEEDGDDMGKTLRRHLSHVSSAYELLLISPCFEVAANRADKDTTITLYQFDGISIDARPSRQEQVIAAMQRTVQGAADRYGIPTYLERADEK